MLNLYVCQIVKWTNGRIGLFAPKNVEVVRKSKREGCCWSHYMEEPRALRSSRQFRATKQIAYLCIAW